MHHSVDGEPFHDQRLLKRSVRTACKIIGADLPPAPHHLHHPQLFRDHFFRHVIRTLNEHWPDIYYICSPPPTSHCSIYSYTHYYCSSLLWFSLLLLYYCFLFIITSLLLFFTITVYPYIVYCLPGQAENLYIFTLTLFALLSYSVAHYSPYPFVIYSHCPVVIVGPVPEP